MPKTTKQRRAEIVHDLCKFGTRTIPQTEFIRTLKDHDVSAPAAIKEYTNELQSGQYIERAEGGYKLTSDSLQEGIITIRVSPSQHRATVVKGLTQALAQFKPLATLEVDVE